MIYNLWISNHDTLAIHCTMTAKLVDEPCVHGFGIEPQMMVQAKVTHLILYSWSE